MVTTVRHGVGLLRAIEMLAALFEVEVVKEIALSDGIIRIGAHCFPNVNQIVTQHGSYLLFDEGVEKTSSTKAAFTLCEGLKSDTAPFQLFRLQGGQVLEQLALQVQPYLSLASLLSFQSQHHILSLLFAVAAT